MSDSLPFDAKLFQIAAEQIKDYAMFLLDPQGRILSWNRGAQLIKGYAPEEIVGRHFSVFYPKDALDSGWPQRELEIAAREGSFEDEGWRVKRNGERFWANVVITALRDEEGRLLAYSKVTRDLSERRLHDEALRQSEERFRLLVEGVVDYAVFMLDPTGVVSSWNRGAEKIKGYSRDEIVGKHFSNFYPPEDVQAGKPWAELATARRDGRAEDEGWRLRKNGERFWARAVVNALYDASGHLRGFAKVTQDLSARRHIQELEAAAQRLNEFIAMLAHEIRNPLAPIRSALALMDRSRPEDPVQLKMRRTIDRQSQRLSRIANDMIEISRVTRGALSIERKPVDMAEVVERAAEAAAPAIERAGHTLSVDLPRERTFVTGDLERLVQVLANLLDNAARYTPDGGGIAVKAWREQRQVALSVRDTGRGIAADEIRSVFGMFVQGRSPLHRVGTGLGVGLALARNIVELHGGTIEALSEGEDKGAEFIVRLPAGQAPAHEERPQAAAPVKAAASQRVLVVDDNADAAATLDLFVKALGHETRVAYDGEQALQAFDEFRPDIVLLDIGLPGMNGYEVARRLRSRSGRGFRIIAVTGWGQAEDRKQSAEAGFDLHLVKPVDEAQLLRILGAEAHGANDTLH
jgi:PAS domain S-box-containing protein